jgi:ABC-type nickel/cobalt efflux system permease component RcnA
MSLETILLTGIYPCPGAILVLVLSLTLDITGIGILAVFAMSLGLSIPIIDSEY